MFETLSLTIKRKAVIHVWAQSVGRVLRSKVQKVKKVGENLVLRYFKIVRFHRSFRVIK